MRIQMFLDPLTVKSLLYYKNTLEVSKLETLFLFQNLILLKLRSANDRI